MAFGHLKWLVCHHQHQHSFLHLCSFVCLVFHLRHVRTATWTQVELGLRVSALNSLLMNPSRTRVEADSHPDVGWSEFNPGWQECAGVAGFTVSLDRRSPWTAYPRKKGPRTVYPRIEGLPPGWTVPPRPPQYSDLIPTRKPGREYYRALACRDKTT